ncbi:flavin reductase family protein [Rhodovarius lipocyclicus]|uniref:flavin reductase family protein n=1 Tax=Rhodovarius lipocyclicus TaxID=268410 RepID=UPI001F338192|nr:flavin reductase family protein [Rhodovarius lipocyclicus]
MRRFATSVALITGRSPGGAPHGMAASSIMSVSMDPCSMLVSVNRSASIHPVLATTGCFCVNLLGHDQRDVLGAFSDSRLRDQRFTSGDWRLGAEGLPYLPSALAAIFCRVASTMDYGTHTLHLGPVIDVIAGEADAPLVWLDGAPAALRHVAG